MKRIKSIKFKNHPILSNLEFNFLKSDGTIYDTVVFAGENGAGKTTILDSLYDVFSFYPLAINASGGNAISTLDYSLEMTYCLSGENISTQNSILVDYAISTYSKTDSHKTVKTKFFDNSDNLINGVQIDNIFAQYSDTAINFSPKNITSSTNKSLDKDTKKSEKTSDDLATEITQLFIDIDLMDAKDEQSWHDTSSEGRIPDSERHKRIKRFKEAFAKIFGSRLIFEGVNSLKVVFNKNGKKPEIGQLSSGEKQIVFRGGFMLKNKHSLSGATILVDEPELSMHPKWQTKILDFYQSLFTDEHNIQTSQIFMTTHSDHILKSALESDNTLIIKLKDSSNPEYFCKDGNSTILSTITLSQVKWLIFDLPTTDLHIELYGKLTEENKINPRDSNLDPAIIYPPIPETYSASVPSGRSDKTLPTYIRNYIDHPESSRIKPSDADFEKSIEFMIAEVKKLPKPNH